MDNWATLYANLPKSAPALAAAGAPCPKRSQSHSDLRERTRRDLPLVMVPESDPEQSESDDEVEIEDDELFEVLQGAKSPLRARKFATVTHLRPPKPFLHRSLNAEGNAERERLRKYATDPIRKSQSQPSERYQVRPPVRSASLPVTGLDMTTPPETPKTLPQPEQQGPTISKPRKARPTPLELIPRFRRPFSPNATPTTPYPSSLLSLYSPRQPLSPNSRTLSLPISFQPSDLPSPARVRISNPLPLSSQTSTKSSTTSSSSPRNSITSTITSSTRSSTSSVDTAETWCEMPVLPTPTAIPSSKKDRIYSTLTSVELRRSSRDSWIR